MPTPPGSGATTLTFPVTGPRGAARLVASWRVVAAVESMLADWRSAIWLSKLALAWLVTNCPRIVACAEARVLSSVNRRS